VKEEKRKEKFNMEKLVSLYSTSIDEGRVYLYENM
jgi:hypothetical protein